MPKKIKIGGVSKFDHVERTPVLKAKMLNKKDFIFRNERKTM